MAKAISLTADDLTPAPQPVAATRPRGAAPATVSEAATVKRRHGVPSDELVPMQFRMPPDFAKAFRLEAVKRGMKYNELLDACFQQFMKNVKPV